MLSISSMFTKDIYGVHLRPDAPEAGLTRIGKRCSWIILGALAMLAILLKDQTSLITLLDRKFDVLVQLVPAFMLGVHWSGLETGPTLAGLVAGLVVALSLAFGTFRLCRSRQGVGLSPRAVRVGSEPRDRGGGLAGSL